MKSDIEQAYKESYNLAWPIRSMLRIVVPQAQVVAIGAKEPSASTTNRFLSGNSPPNVTGIEHCINSEKASAQMTIRCLFFPAEVGATAEVDVQIALDPDLFTNDGKRKMWTDKSERKDPGNPFVNFYSSRQAGHTKDPVKGPRYDFAVPYAVSQSLYCDFPCTTKQEDHDKKAPAASPEQSAAEHNLRSLRFFVRVLVKETIGGTEVVLASDVEKPTEGRLLGFFHIGAQSGNAGARTHGGTTYEPEAVIIHVFVGTFNGKAPSFDGGKSSHYVIGDKGEIWRYVDESKVAFHAAYVTKDLDFPWRTIKKNGSYLKGGKWQSIATGEPSPNIDTLGIEHEGTESSIWPVKKYAASAWLVQDMYTRWSKLTLDAERILPHRTINSGKSCPGKVADMGRLIRYAKGYRNRKQESGQLPLYE